MKARRTTAESSFAIAPWAGTMPVPNIGIVASCYTCNLCSSSGPSPKILDERVGGVVCSSGGVGDEVLERERLPVASAHRRKFPGAAGRILGRPGGRIARRVFVGIQNSGLIVIERAAMPV